MKIYERGVEITSFPLWRYRGRRGGLEILQGVAIHRGRCVPVYVRLIHGWRSAGVLYIEVPGGLLCLMKRRPFLVWDIYRRQNDHEDSL